MELIIQKNRNIEKFGTYGTQHENDVTELKLNIPEEYENWNKRIVFLTDDGNFWDYIENDTYLIKRNITKYKTVQAYVWLTNEDEDFRTKEFMIEFNDNQEADDQTPTEEQIDGFNTLITTLNLKINKVEELETNITQLMQDIRKEVDEEVSKIEDMTESYNANALEKVEQFDANVLDKTNAFNDNYQEKLDAYNSNADTRLQEYNDNHTTKKEEYNQNASEKENAINAIATDIRNMVNSLEFATFDVDENMNLCVNTAESLGNMGFSVNDNGELEVEING